MLHDTYLNSRPVSTMVVEVRPSVPARISKITLSDPGRVRVITRHASDPPSVCFAWQHLWDQVFIVRDSIEDWKGTPWKEVNVGNMDIECKKFSKDIRGRCPDDWHLHRCFVVVLGDFGVITVRKCTILIFARRGVIRYTTKNLEKL